MAPAAGEVTQLLADLRTVVSAYQPRPRAPIALIVKTRSVGAGNFVGAHVYAIDGGNVRLLASVGAMKWNTNVVEALKRELEKEKKKRSSSSFQPQKRSMNLCHPRLALALSRRCIEMDDTIAGHAEPEVAPEASFLSV